MPGDAAPTDSAFHRSLDDDMLSQLAARAAAEGGVDPASVEAFLHGLLAAIRRGDRLSDGQRQASRERGAAAADRGLPAPAFIDVHLTVAARLVPHLPDLLSSPAGRRPSAEAQAAAVQSLLWALRDAVDATVEGFADVRRDLVRREASMRREFVDDLLGGRADVARLVERAAFFGLPLGPPHVVGVVWCAGQHLEEPAAVRHAERVLRTDLGVDDSLVATKDGALVCVVGLPPQAPDDRSSPATTWNATASRTTEPRTTTSRATALRSALIRIGSGLCAPGGAWQGSIGGVHGGTTGVHRSYDEAREALDLARRLKITDPVVDIGDFLVYRVLLRDRSAMADLVIAVLGPLRDARGGAEPLVRTLLAYFDARGVSVTAAQDLFLSVRALAYRLERIRLLTGYDVNDPHHRFTLQAAVLGARLLEWPERPLP